MCWCDGCFRGPSLAGHVDQDKRHSRAKRQRGREAQARQQGTRGIIPGKRIEPPLRQNRQQRRGGSLSHHRQGAFRQHEGAEALHAARHHRLFTRIETRQGFLDQVRRDVSTRYDLKDSNTEIDLEEGSFTITTASDMTNP